MTNRPIGMPMVVTPAPSRMPRNFGAKATSRMKPK